MTFFKTLKGRLTLGTGAVLAVVTMAILLLLQSLLGGLDKELIKAFRARAAANAKAISTDVAFEIATKAPKALKKKLTKFRKENRETHSIAVLGGDQSQLAKVGAGEINARFLQAMRDKDTARTVVQGELIIAMAPVIPEGEKKVVGYVIYTESLAAYHSKRKRTMTIGFSVIILLVLLALAGVYVIGHRTTKPFAMLVQTAQQIASGNLEDTTLDGGGALETQSLAGSITTMGLALRKQVLAIKALTNRVAAVAKEVSEAMSHLATAAVQQSSAVTETAATVEEMERNGHVAAENANQIAESAEQTSKTSIQGRDAVSTTGQIILRIQENSEDIRTKSQNLLTDVEEVGAIIGSVNAIAEQSKILAVNASIEAAKAGEYGAGFAVVAQEVKDLALQSKEATLQITQTLNAIRQAIDTMVNTAHAGASRTEEGVKTVANAGAIVNDLSEAINENSEFAKVIAANVKQQATGLTQIATAMTQINSASTESREVGSKIINETGQLTEAVEELATLVNQWTIPERGDADPVPSAQQQVA